MSRLAQPAVFGATLLLATAALAACSSNGPASIAAATSVVPARSAEPVVTVVHNSPASKALTSDVSQLKGLGIVLNAGVLIDVADDGRDRYLAIGKGGVVDFTGTDRTDNTMMALKPARVAKRTEATRNRVVIAPPFYNEDLGAGSCVADTAAGRLRLATCDAKAANQIWRVIPVGDSGQFELHGPNTVIRVDSGRLTTGDRGYVGLQTIPFAE